MNIFGTVDPNSPKWVTTEIQPLEIKSNFSAWNWQVLDSSNIAVLFLSRMAGKNLNEGYMASEVADPIRSYIYKVNIESGAFEFLAASGKELELHLYEGQLVVSSLKEKRHFSISKNTGVETEYQTGSDKKKWYRIEGATKELVKIAPIETKPISKAAEWKEFVKEQARELAFSGNQGLLCSMKKLLFIDTEKKQITHVISLKDSVKFLEARYIDENNVHLIAEGGGYSKAITLNSFVKRGDTWFWDTIMPFPFYRTGNTDLKWELTENVYRIFMLYGLEHYDYSPYRALHIYDLRNQLREKKTIQISIKPLPHYSGKIELRIPSKDHHLLLQRAKEAGMSLPDYLKQSLHKLASGNDE